MGESRYRRRCRGADCNALIALLPTPGGARLPIDVHPSPDGNVIVDIDLLGEPVAHVLTARGVAQARASSAKLYTPHFATCPNADDFRRATDG